MKKIKVSIGFKLIFFFILMLIISLGISSYYSYQNYSKTLVDESESELKAISVLKKKAIEGYFDELLSDLSISAKSPILRNNFSDYDRRVNKKLDKAVSDYLDLLKEEHGWYDAFLMDLKGNVIYTVEKEADYGTNLEDGVYRDSGLAKAYKKGRKELSIIDFSYYEASKDIAAFVSAPIRDKNNQLRGVIALQIPIDKINNIMQERTGMGRSGETYLVGSDYLMRSNSRFGNGKDILKKEVNTLSVTKALQGEEGVDTIKDYRDVKVLSYHTPLQIKDHNWVLIAEIDEAEVKEPLNNLIKKVYKMTWIIALVIILLSGLLIFFLIIRPVKKVQSIMNKIANNNLSSEVEFKSNDELGEMSNDINKTISSLSGILKRIRSSAESVSKSSNQIASDNSNLAERTQNQASALEELSATIEEMTASIQEVAANSEDTDVLSKNTVDFVEEGSKVIKKTIDSMEDISKRSEEISDIIALVNEIAAQTNLLSLNAAIEAARAGEHGKGFAVVAEQVRDLALRTANSSKKIESLIHNIINKIDEGSSLIVEADNSLENIIKNSQKTSRGIEEIAVAMDEQSSAAEQIQIAIEELNSLTQDNVVMVEEVNQTSDYLEEESNGLFEIIEKFELK